MKPSAALTATGCAIAVLLALWSVLDFYSATEVMAGPAADTYKIADQELRFQQAAAALPPAGEVGYVTDQTENREWVMFLGAQYVLAPRVLVALDKHPHSPWVVGNFARRFDVAQFANARGLKLVQDFGGGVVLFGKGAP